MHTTRPHPHQIAHVRSEKAPTHRGRRDTPGSLEAGRSQPLAQGKSEEDQGRDRGQRTRTRPHAAALVQALVAPSAHLQRTRGQGVRRRQCVHADLGAAVRRVRSLAHARTATRAFCLRDMVARSFPVAPSATRRAGRPCIPLAPLAILGDLLNGEVHVLHALPGLAALPDLEPVPVRGVLVGNVQTPIIVAGHADGPNSAFG
mmetsp:Transcript_46769/g.99956  ORF Transcript_46769/g.99956 Transcript_46769/m.99956 type:complete len:203 (-) Transcript_46769:882-1490(-)